MRDLLARRPDLDAVFVASDVMAAGARQVLREADRRIPGDVALVGFDDSVVARHMHPAPHQRPPAHRGDGPPRWPSSLLDEIMAAPRVASARSVVPPTELVVRDSS